VFVFVFVRRSASSSCRATCHLTNNPHPLQTTIIKVM